jgi:hypothetical protein
MVFRLRWYGSLKTGIEPELTLIFFPDSLDRLSGTTYILHCRASRLDITSNVPENTYKRDTSTELESFLTELTAELRSTPEAAEPTWKGYYPEQKGTHVEPQKSSRLSAVARVSDRCPQNSRF